MGTTGFNTSNANSSSMAVTTDGIPYVAFQDPSANNKPTVMKFNQLALAAVWKDFQVQKDQQQTLVYWSTHSEQQTKDFQVQHSTNGNNWRTVGTVAAAGNSQAVNQYNFKHANPTAGINYYRIQLTDRDESQRYSSIRSLQFDRSFKRFEVLGNPVGNGTLSIQINPAENQTLQLFNNAGQLIWSKVFAQGFHSAKVGNQPKGIYWLKAADQSEKIMVQNQYKTLIFRCPYFCDT
jgi:hypothetical protein